MKPTALLLALLACCCLSAQPLNEAALLQALRNRDKDRIAATDSSLVFLLPKTDSAKRALFQFYSAQSQSEDPWVAARSLLWQGILALRPPFNNRENAVAFLQQAVNKAVESGDEYLMVSVFDFCAGNFMSAGKAETALFYFLKSAELRQNLGENFYYKNVHIFGTLGELLYRMQEYRQAIAYIRRTVALPLKGHAHPHTSSLNTLGLCYQRLGRYDSALYWYGQSLASAKANGDTVWTGIVSGNTGAVYFEQKQDAKALPLLWTDYRSSLKIEPANAGNTLHRLALIYLRGGKADSALLLAQRSLQLVRTAVPLNDWFLCNAYQTLATVFRQRNQNDSALAYTELYYHLHDSLVRTVAAGRADVVQTKLAFEKTSNRIGVLLAEKQAEQNRRNLLLAGLLLVLAAGWFYLRWQKQVARNRQQALRHQKEKAEAAMQNAKERLQEFTQSLLAKNDLVESLQRQVQQQNHKANEELLQQSILTENDWLRFREMFAKAYPGFIAQLQALAPGITNAEVRLATLIRLNVGNKHMAFMLGVGTDAVRKTKSRLRQRLQFSVDGGLEAFLRDLTPDPSPAKLERGDVEPSEK